MEPMSVGWIDTFRRNFEGGYTEHGLLGVFVRHGREYPEAEVIAFARAAAHTAAPLSYLENRRNRHRAVFFEVEGGPTVRWPAKDSR